MSCLHSAVNLTLVREWCFMRTVCCLLFLRDWCLSRQLWWGHRIPAYRFLVSTSMHRVNCVIVGLVNYHGIFVNDMMLTLQRQFVWLILVSYLVNDMLTFRHHFVFLIPVSCFVNDIMLRIQHYFVWQIPVNCFVNGIMLTLRQHFVFSIPESCFLHDIMLTIHFVWRILVSCLWTI